MVSSVSLQHKHLHDLFELEGFEGALLGGTKGMFGLGKKTCVSLSFFLFMKSKGANFV